jgi:hypothetical protein
MIDSESREHVQRLLANADWDPETGEATIPSEHRSHPHVFSGIEGLRDFLVKAYEEMWFSRAPFEGGVVVDGYEPDGLSSVNEELEERSTATRSKA